MEEKEENKGEEQKEVEEKIEEKKEKLQDWLKNPGNLALIAVLIFAFIIRLYYFSITKNQPLWWDESEYMAGAKGYAGIINYKLSALRTPGLSILASLFFRLGITSEPVIRFLVAFIPAILVLLLLYMCLKEMYPDRKIALISVAILSVLWEHLFYSNRFHTENLSLIFQFLAIFVLFRSYVKGKDFWFIKARYALLLILVFSVISAVFRPGNIIFFPALVLFVLILNKSKIFNKTGIIITIVVIVGAILSLIFIEIPSTGIFGYYHPENPLAWHSFNVLYGFYQSYVSWIPSLLFYAFLLGLILFFMRFYLLYPRFKKISKTPQNLDFKSDIFNFLLLLCVMGFFIFIMRDRGFEYRWFFPFLTAFLAFTSKGVISFSKFVGGMINNKKVTTGLIILITVLGVYTQIIHADQIIKMKVPSYQQVKDSGLWIKENSNKGDIIISASEPQHYYYTEGEVYGYYRLAGPENNESAFDNNLTRVKPRYLIVSVFEPGFTPPWAYDWPQRHPELVTPVKSYFSDAAQTQPILVVYEFNQNAL